jgi:hypothetical protein
MGRYDGTELRTTVSNLAVHGGETAPVFVHVYTVYTVGHTYVNTLVDVWVLKPSLIAYPTLERWHHLRPTVYTRMD